MTEFRTAVNTEPPPDAETPAPAAQDAPTPGRTALWRRLAEAVVAVHRADVPF